MEDALVLAMTTKVVTMIYQKLGLGHRFARRPGFPLSQRGVRGDFLCTSRNDDQGRNVGWLAGVLLFFVAGLVHAQTLVAVNDSFAVPFGQPLQIEAFGVLDNDTLAGEPAGENGATAELVNGVANGTLSCPTDSTVALCADGSFNYTPGPNFSFSGTDSFNYHAVSGSMVSSLATVTLTACAGGPQVYSCWLESSYLAKLAEFGYGTFHEGFEGTTWDAARSPNSAASIASKGITWTSNHPNTNDITTGTGPARTGQWGVYDPDHGIATGTPGECDINNPPVHCLFYDGFSATIATGTSTLHGVGGYISGTAGSNVSIIHGATQSGFGALPDSGFHFLAVIDARAAGFTGFEFRELDGKIGQANLIFGDDFIIATSSLDIDDNGAVDALTDGLLIIRYLFGIGNPDLIIGAVGKNAKRSKEREIETYLSGLEAAGLLDVDDNANNDAATDGFLAIRYLLGLRGQALIDKAVDKINGNRTTATAIEKYLESLIP